MPTLGDYSSILEIGIGLNLAVSYIGTFVEPSIRRAENEMGQFRWWIDAPGRLGQVSGRSLDPADFEESLSEWITEADSMKRSIKKHRTLPTTISLAAAALLFSGLFFPFVPVSTWGLIGLAFLALVPVFGGAMYVWCRTRGERRSEREKARAANGVLIGR